MKCKQLYKYSLLLKGDEKMLASDEIVQYEYDVPKSQNEKTG